jgi:hypothetical protein
MRIEFSSGPAETADAALARLEGLLQALGTNPEALPVLRELETAGPTWASNGRMVEARVTATAQDGSFGPTWAE